MKIILILFSFCLAVEIEGEKIGETSRKSRSRIRTDRDKRKLEKKTLRLIQKLQKTQVRPPIDWEKNLMKKGTLFYSGSWYRLQGFWSFHFTNIYDPYRLYNCSLFVMCEMSLIYGHI